MDHVAFSPEGIEILYIDKPSIRFIFEDNTAQWLEGGEVRKTTQHHLARDPVQRIAFSSPHFRFPTSGLKAQSRWPDQFGTSRAQGFNRQAVGRTTSDALCPSPVVRLRDHSGPCLHAFPEVLGLRSSSSRTRRRGWVPAKAADRAVHEVHTAAHAQHV